jgi:hypothetical protein
MIRRANRVFEKGTIRFIDVTGEYAIFEREDKALGEKALVILNRSKKKLTKSVSDLTSGAASYEIIRGLFADGSVCTEPFGYSVIKIKL